MSETAVPSKLELASRVAKYARLHDLRLASASCTQNTMFGPEGSERIDVKISHGSTALVDAPIVIEDPANRPDARFFRVVARFQILGFRSPEEELFKVEAEFELLYLVPPEVVIPQEEAAAFAELNGVFNAWSFWREIVSSMTSRMGLSTITVPLFRPLEHKV